MAAPLPHSRRASSSGIVSFCVICGLGGVMNGMRLGETVLASIPTETLANTMITARSIVRRMAAASTLQHVDRDGHDQLRLAGRVRVDRDRAVLGFLRRLAEFGDDCKHFARL